MSAVALTPPPQLELDAGQARRLAVTAAGFGQPHSAAVLRHTGLLQLDPLSRVEKAHRLTCLTRMPRTASADTIDGPLWSDTGMASAFETWVHAACLVPIEHWPLLRLARERVRAAPKRPPEPVLAEVRDLVAGHLDGATISDIEGAGQATTGWQWSARKRAVEHMLRSGELICSRRRGPKRLFDLPERRVPADLLAADLPADAIRATLAGSALAAMGVATTRDVARYYNLTPSDAALGLDAADATPVRVQGWSHTAWIPAHPADPGPPPGEPVLVGPFDNLLWDRDRVRRLFGFDYTFEAYKPAAKRVHGYYVLAVLQADLLIGRADLRRNPDGTLDTITALPEPTTDTAQFTQALAAARHRLQQGLLRPSSPGGEGRAG